MNHPITQLATGQITRSSHDVIEIDLVEPDGMPPVIRINWPETTITTPAQLDAVVAAAMRTLSRAVVELAALKVWKKL
jgi:hypothetical protein